MTNSFKQLFEKIKKTKNNIENSKVGKTARIINNIAMPFFAVYLLSNFLGDLKVSAMLFIGLTLIMFGLYVISKKRVFKCNFLRIEDNSTLLEHFIIYCKVFYFANIFTYTPVKYLATMFALYFIIFGALALIGYIDRNDLPSIKFFGLCFGICKNIPHIVTFFVIINMF